MFYLSPIDVFFKETGPEHAVEKADGKHEGADGSSKDDKEKGRVEEREGESKAAEEFKLQDDAAANISTAAAAALAAAAVKAKVF